MSYVITFDIEEVRIMSFDHATELHVSYVNGIGHIDFFLYVLYG